MQWFGAVRQDYVEVDVKLKIDIFFFWYAVSPTRPLSLPRDTQHDNWPQANGCGLDVATVKTLRDNL